MKTLKNSMTNKGKKGFTLTELAIVIAVIAILIAVLVPTFSSVISKAKASNESVACSNEWTNYYIDADIAANGTKDNYLVVYTDNKYTENDTTYYHGYLATAGVYDSTTQLNVEVDLKEGIATYNKNSYNYVGSYEYMAKEVSIFSTGVTTSLITTYDYSNPNLAISGNGNAYYISGEITYTDNTLTDYGDGTTCLFAIRIYFDVKIDNMTSLTIKGTETKIWNNETTKVTGVESADLKDIKDGDYYIDFSLRGNTTKYTITYTYADGSNTITIYNNATPFANTSAD